MSDTHPCPRFRLHEDGRFEADPPFVWYTLVVPFPGTMGPIEHRGERHRRLDTCAQFQLRHRSAMVKGLEISWYDMVCVNAEDPAPIDERNYEVEKLQRVARTALEYIQGAPIGRELCEALKEAGYL